MKTKLFSIILLFIAVFFTAQAQESPKEQHKSGAVLMLQFFSSGDTTIYNKAMEQLRAAHVGYKKELASYKKNTSGSSYDDILYGAKKEIVQSNIQLLEGELTITFGNYTKDKIVTETEKDRKKKIKAGGKDYLVSKFAYDLAKSLVITIEGK